MISDDIRNADTADAIYILLAAYVERERSRDKLTGMPEYLPQFPVRGIADVSLHFEKLVAALNLASKQLNNEACVVIKEALHIFATALHRLRSLKCVGFAKSVRGRHESTQFTVAIL